jgi:hypothetical protein
MEALALKTSAIPDHLLANTWRTHWVPSGVPQLGASGIIYLMHGNRAFGSMFVCSHVCYRYSERRKGLWAPAYSFMELCAVYLVSCKTLPTRRATGGA